MNNMMFPYIIPYQNTQAINIEEEIKLLKYEINILKEKIEKIEKIENKEQNKYLQKEDGKYMM